jgi:UDP-glucose-4-epimerase GalE
MEKVLVTGASGYIGSVVCKLAKNCGWYVSAIDPIKPSHTYYDCYVQATAGHDIVREIITVGEIKKIFHLGAIASVPDSLKHPSKYYRNNTGDTAALLDNLQAMNWRGHIVFSSTAAVYGNQYVPCSETISSNPINPYGHSKLMCEKIIEDVAIHYGLNATVFRYFNVAGSYNNIGDHLDSDHVLQRISESSITKSAFYVFGGDYDTRDGSCLRDFVHVKDVARAHFFVDRKVSLDKPSFNVYNLGTYTGTTVIELANKFKKMTGEQLNIKYKDRRPGDPPVLIASAEKIKGIGFEFKHSDIEEIIGSSWEYYKGKYNER